MIDKVFIDTDIVIDVLTQREPFYASAAQVFSLAAENRIELFISPVLLANLFYILRKKLGWNEAIMKIKKLRNLVSITTIDEKVVDCVLASGFRDVEDGFQYYSALRDTIPCLLTRNTKDFIGREIAVMNCEEFLSSHKIDTDR